MERLVHQGPRMTFGTKGRAQPIAILFMTAACSGRVTDSRPAGMGVTATNGDDGAPTSVVGTSQTDAGDPQTATMPTAVPTTGPAACRVHGYVLPIPPDEATFRKRLEGSWERCSPPTAGNSVGVEFGTSEWHRLYRDAGGALVRGTAPDDGGPFEIIESPQWQSMPPLYQINYCSPATGCLAGWTPDFTTEPRMMNFNGDPDETYVASGESVLSQPAEKNEPLVKPTDACTLPFAPVTSWTLPEARAFLARRWLSCGEAITQSPGDVGVDLDESGEWHALVEDSPGLVFRGHGFGREGFWEVVESASSSNPPGTYGLNLWHRGAGFNNASLTITTSPPRMAVDTWMPITYVAGG